MKIDVSLDLLEEMARCIADNKLGGDEATEYIKGCALEESSNIGEIEKEDVIEGATLLLKSALFNVEEGSFEEYDNLFAINVVVGTLSELVAQGGNIHPLLRQLDALVEGMLEIHDPSTRH